jgi:VWFA-related protein
MNAVLLRIWPVIVCASIVGAGWPGRAQGARDGLVPIHVAVADAAGTSVTGLTKDDFAVLVDDAPKEIVTFAAPPSPISVVLLLDVTSSMAVYTDMRDEIARTFVPTLLPVDRARVGGIANRLELAPQFSSDARAIVSAGRAATSFDKGERNGPSPIWDALDGTFAALDEERGVRGIILVTDGRSTGNHVSATAVLQRAVAEGIVMYVLTEARPIVIRQNATSFARVRSGLLLQELARRTGGLCVPEEPAPGAQLPTPGPILSRFVQDLRGMYTLAVSPDGASGSAHRVQITVKRPGLTARARGVYRMGS